ncbi:MAG: AAA family ATPase [Sedimentibacter saalensis]|uniref:ATP-dependent nuclease n=1 Tax=Sedimentibacter saalensis TaxID=130788 RepID=UPI002B1FAAEC|nr:AAA family ATPase [Sedimentibacter saalensis]MEA5096477.1 AAA family ATPase [Sedimentibacter saalensis]
MQQLYISKIHIENYRNFAFADFELTEKQVVIGENNVGKSNLLRAIQLILDSSFSDEDRQLDETDFFDGLENPMESKQEIKIDIYIDNYAHIKNVLCQLSDATVDVNGRKLLKLSYKFFPQEDAAGNTEYSYIIFKGDDETKLFTHEDRKYLNIRVIKAIRDVESEMRNSKSSPLTKLIKQKYDIKADDIKSISDALRKTGANTLDLPELIDLQKKISTLFNSIVAFSRDEFDISLKTMDIDASRILYALKPLVNMREASNTSLGINNVLYISLMLLLIADDTVKTYLSSSAFDELKQKEDGKIIEQCYSKIEKGYVLKLGLQQDVIDTLYKYMYEQNANNLGITILAIEEPEAHLHPIYQRLLYKYVVHNSNSPVIITTHSTHISSVAPITSIVHLVGQKFGTSISTTAKMSLSDKEEADLARYIDVKRGEVYLAKGIIFVEGISEEYLVPSFAQTLGVELDRYGIVVCNINSTNFLPYRQFADLLNIPNVIITDGDYYHIEDKEKIFGDVYSKEHKNFGYAGSERAIEICSSFMKQEQVKSIRKLSWADQDEAFNNVGIFVGNHTFEIDIFGKALESDKAIFSQVFRDLTNGGNTQCENFENNLKSNKYTKCLTAIESSHSQIGKGRFAQRLASSCRKTMIPSYVNDAINYICERVGK